MNWLKYFFEFQYRFGKPRWDTNVTPPEVVETIERGNIGRGRMVSPTIENNLQQLNRQGENVRRALDLGCGTGTNSIYLARAGFQVVGVDFSAKAIAAARDKARRENIAADFLTGDVTRLDALGANDPFDFILDIGCFHSVEPSRWKNYAAELSRLTRPGALFMLYAFSPRKMLLRRLGATSEEVKQTFAEYFSLERVEEGTDRGEFSSAWYWFRRQSSV